MQIMLRDIKSDALYEMELSWRALSEIIDLMNGYREIEKKYDINTIGRLFYIVFADCLGDVMDVSSSDSFLNCNIPNFIFVDPYSWTNQWVLIAHELIHSLQQYLYLFPNDNHYDDWTDIMARELEGKVRDILCNKSFQNILFKFVTRDEEEIEGRLYRHSGIDKIAELDLCDRDVLTGLINKLNIRRGYNEYKWNDIGGIKP